MKVPLLNVRRLNVRGLNVRLLSVALLGTFLGAGLWAPAAAGDQACGNGDTYGTAIHWVPTAAEAKKLARDEDKLIFVVHLSGNFTRDEFT